MKILNHHRRWIALCLVFAFLYLIEISNLPLHAERNAPARETEISKSSDGPNVIEREADTGYHMKKKHFPWLLVIIIAVVVGGAVYYYLNYMRKFKLNVTRGEGVSGAPESGIKEYKRGESVNYSYTLASGYRNLVVTLDNAPMAASGTVTMKANHTLKAEATKEVVLTVNVSEGVTGTPVTGTYTYPKGQSVSYSYSLLAGYSDLEVKLDGVPAAVVGSFAMENSRTLTATCHGPKRLTVTRGFGVSGTPDTGTYTHPYGASVSYSYKPFLGYHKLSVKLDGTDAAAAGSFNMTENHVLETKATNGLDLEWLLNGNAQDTSNMGRHGTVYGATLTSDHRGYVNRAYYFDGVNDYIHGPVFTTGTNEITVSFWVYLYGATGGAKKFFIVGADHAFSQQDNQIFWRTWDNSTTDETSCIVNYFAWTHIVGTYNGTTLRIYRNGSLQSSKNYSILKASKGYSYEIGRWSGTYLRCRVDDIRNYSFVIPDSDIQLLYTW